MQGASFSLLIQDVETGTVVFAYDTIRQMSPASVLKTVTTATALELLGEDYQFPTTISYDGRIEQGVLRGNLYIEGSGDPTLGSRHFAADKNNYRPDQNRFIPQWITAIQNAGIQQIEGRIIADESIFDTEGTSMKWMQEDLGADYGAGSYGISIFDNSYSLYLRTGKSGTKPLILRTDPELPTLRFHNQLVARSVSKDSCFLIGQPFVQERFLYGIVPANRETFELKGSLPDPALFAATYLTQALEKAGIHTQGKPVSSRLLKEAGKWNVTERTEIITTLSPTLKEIVRVTNEVSHNLFADALLKTIGLKYNAKADESISSFDRGIKILRWHWASKGFDLGTLCMDDGSGLAITDKVSSAFMNRLLCYMATQSPASNAFMASLPKAGMEGSVRNFLKGTPLQGKAHLKSGSMSHVRAYAGYVYRGDHLYAITLLVNQYNGEGRFLTRQLEKLITSLF